MIDVLIGAAWKWVNSPQGMGTIYQAGSRLLSKKASVPSNVCAKSGATMAQLNRCPKCGAKKQFGRYCSSCGTKLA